MKKIGQFIQHFWHWIFIILCLIIIGGSFYSEHLDQVKQQHEAREVSSGQISNQQLHENGILILCYHRVVNNHTFSSRFALTLSNNDQLHEYSMPVDKLAYQIHYLKDHGVRIIPISTAVKLIKENKPLKHKYVVLTFDDVDSTLTSNVYPLFKKLGNIPYTAFIVTSNTGRYDNGTRLATWKQLHKVLKSPNVTIGVHTNNMHYLIDNKPALKYARNYPRFKKDYQKSEKIIKKKIGHRTPYFAYPYGEGTKREQKYLADHDMVTFSLDNGIVTPGYDLRQPLPRTMVDEHSWNNVIKKWVNASVEN
ncbi:polysaccharide deacetylase family protein [Ligilactobacillus araffinosus]|uniref:Polysaccharide deacetylase n=1 Tax=Ligilactobacillus araffinosus DSM 20653 TaxID=1423820 RepID=A0A0R1ZN65_9LACO|nr:polysaccharide deacetylase family protein [Ligilactobacillus araffinosus]KRM52921.1 polysaccharide deacetylase [Ligilactobacillus araffinosus DSM 20653]